MKPLIDREIIHIEVQNMETTLSSIEDAYKKERRRIHELFRVRIRPMVISALACTDFDERVASLLEFIEEIRLQECLDEAICLDCRPLSRESRMLIWDLVRENICDTDGFCCQPHELKEKLIDCIIDNILEGGD